MDLRTCLIIVLGLAVSSCGSDDGGSGGVSALLDSLQGDYTVHAVDGCVVEVRGSNFTTRAADGKSTCSEGDASTLGGLKWLSVSGSFSDTRISGTIEYNDSPDALHTTIILNKRLGRSVEGRFAALAGEWEGTARYRRKSTDIPEEGTSNVFVDVHGDSIAIEYDDRHQLHRVEVRDQGSNGISVDGTSVPFEAR